MPTPTTAQCEAWHTFIGSQTQAEFLEYSESQDPETAVCAYLDEAWTDYDDWDYAEIRDALVAVIEADLADREEEPKCNAS